MAEFLSIKEVAQYLNVEYKTVYRLIQKGEIPAGKVGGVYRVAKSDIDDYFQAQKKKTAESSKPGFGDGNCSCCGRKLLSALSVAGHCEECGEAICNRCWVLEGLRLCAADSKKAAESNNETSDESVLICATCSSKIMSAADLGGRCDKADCGEPICTKCWTTGGHRLCRVHESISSGDEREDYPEVFDASSGVSSTDAKMREISFIGRFDMKVQDLKDLVNPADGKKLKIKSWAKYHSKADDQKEIVKKFPARADKKEMLKSLPTNLRSIYKIDVRTRASATTPVDQLVIEAMSCSRLERHLEKGGDPDPISLAELIGVLNERANEAERGTSLVMLGLGSPTGWDEEVIEYIRGDEPGHSFRHPRLIACLVDLTTGEVHYNAADERIKTTAELFSSELDDEAVARAEAHVKEILLIRDSASLQQVAEDQDLDEKIIQKAFDNLASTGKYRIDDIKGVGTTISESI